ncbi:phosphomethylpyrimidine kinase [Raphidocelis subcapitata]|uniref:thiamine phosphate synthase n=1 Tax=Raphidocelis subcapitata TaxID=307507 RepID=A0A2V0PBE0_9CHLO|nr:phosphomethylpyrimidine kinase [Raphidocelis subcapitata]|eukprot:GBF95200.1 phosphomethylpyrimidine kinase [Raphidocelis subcapitata]
MAHDPDPAGLPLPGGVSERLWGECQLEAFRALQHPFVLALGLGTLPRDTFRHYVAQDAHFLHFFARAYAAALDKCADANAEAHVVLQQLLMGVHMELRLHGSYARTWGVELDALDHVDPACQAYTDFLMATAEDPETTVAEVLASMVPCSRLYGFLGCALARAHPRQRGNPYADWISMYSSFEYLVHPMQKEALLDRLAGDAPYDRLRSLYKRAMQLEVAFFSAAPGIPAARHVGMLVCDFDDTCTEKDTIGTLLSAAIDAAVKRAGPEEGPRLRARLDAVVARLVENYSSKHAALLAEILPEGASAAAAEGGFDEAGLRAFVERLSDFDVQMNAVAVESGILAGLSRDDVAAAARAVALKPGCREALAAALGAELPTHVVSVNWSREFVAAALGLPAADAADWGAAGSDGDEAAAAVIAGAAPPPGRLAIHANELARGADGLSTGALRRAVQCARDKGRLFAALQAARGKGGGGGGAAVFVGDSATDVLPLLAADYGIVVGSNKLLRRALARHGASLVPLCAAPLTAPARGGGGAASDGVARVVYEAASWDEIHAFLFGPNGGAVGGGGGGVVHVGSGSGSGCAVLPRVLTVAGSDSGGGAGIQADLKTVMALGCFGMSAITALTAQNSRGVQAVHPVPPDFLEAQLDSVLSDIGTDAVKTGMLPDAATVRLVARKLRQYGIGALVVDPVMISTSGHALASGGVAEAMVRDLLPLAALVTPNIPEAEALLGGAVKIDSVAGMREAAAALQALGPRAVLVKGGHMVAQQAEERRRRRQQQAAAAAADGAAADGGDGDGDEGLVAVDILFDGERFLELRAPYVETGNTHGTGCTLGAASAAGLARGLPVAEAVREAKAYLTAALAGSAALRMGAGPQHPFHHGVGFVHEGAAGTAAAAALAEAGGPELTRQLSTRIGGTGGAAGPARGGLGRELSAELGRRASSVPRHRPLPCDLRLYVVTDPDCNARAGRGLADAVADAVAGGATIVQVREKGADGGDFLSAARAALRVCRAAGVPLIINDRVDVALAVDADGVHVGQDDLPARAVRRLIGPGKLLGVSVKTAGEAVKAAADGADYLGAGAVVPTGTKDASVIGFDGLGAVCAAVDIPVVAIGGVGAANAAEAVAAGAAGVAVVSAVFSAPDAAAAAAEIRRVVDDALAAAPAAAAEAEAAAVGAAA